MTWILIIIISWGRGVSTEQVVYQSQTACVEAALQIVEINNKLGMTTGAQAFCIQGGS